MGIDVSSIEPREYEKNQTVLKAKRFIYIGNISALRKLELLTDAIEEACRMAGMSSKLRFDFYGTGDSVEDFRRSISRYRPEGLIRYRGLLAQDELFRKLHTYDVGISYIPYERYDNAPPLKTLEYMAAKIPVIGSDTRGNRMYINDRHNGLLFENSLESIARLITECVKEGYPLEYVDNAYDGIDIHDWDAIMKNSLVPMYKEIIAGE